MRVGTNHHPSERIKSPFSGSRCVLALAGNRRCVVQIEALKHAICYPAEGWWDMAAMYSLTHQRHAQKAYSSITVAQQPSAVRLPVPFYTPASEPRGNIVTALCA